LASKGWTLSFKGIPNNEFELQSGNQQEIIMELLPGKEFDKQEVENSEDRDILISVYTNDILVGGMTYRLDPQMREPANRPPQKKV
jgi:zinc metalloprotease ZmpB